MSENSHSINQQGYDALSSWWKTTRDQSFVSKLIIDLVDILPSKAKILDIGCGTGYPIASFISVKGHIVTGIDVSEKMIHFARALELANATFRHSDLMDYAPSETYDAIIAWDSLWHIDHAKQLDIYPKIASWLKPGGYLIFTAGDTDDYHVNDTMGAPIYHAAKPKEDVWKALKNNDVSIVYTFLDFKEKGTDRGMVILGRKM